MIGPGCKRRARKGEPFSPRSLKPVAGKAGPRYILRIDPCTVRG